MRVVMLGLLLWSFAASPLSGRTIYVDNVAGDDAFSGVESSPAAGSAGPVRSINKALRLARKGDRVVVANTGVAYRETVSLSGGDHSGRPLEWFVIEGNGAVLDGSLNIDPYAWEPVQGKADVFRFRPPRMAYQQLFLAGVPLERVAVPSERTVLPPLEPLQWCLLEGSIYFRSEAGKWIDLYDLAHAGSTVGITLYHVHHVAVTDLVVQGFQLDGLNAHDVRETTLYAITSRGNGRSGIAVTSSSRVLIDGCLLGDNGAAQLWTEGHSITRVRDSQLLANTAPDIVRHGGQVLVEPSAPPVAPAESAPEESAPLEQ